MKFSENDNVSALYIMKFNLTRHALLMVSEFSCSWHGYGNRQFYKVRSCNLKVNLKQGQPLALNLSKQAARKLLRYYKNVRCQSV